MSPFAAEAAAPPRPVLWERVLADAAELEALRPQWEEMLRDSAADEVTLAPDWQLGWRDVFGGLQGRRPLGPVAWHDAGGRLAGLALMTVRRVLRRGLVPFRRLEPLGAGEPEADSVCTEYLNVPARRGLERSVADALARLITEAADGWDELV